MKVGVVIITYNNQNVVSNTINSVRDQILTDWKCVIVDNGSTDNTFEIINDIIEGDNRFESFKKLNEGPSAGRNMGFEKIKTHVDYVHFLDGDDVLSPSFLLKLSQYLDDHPEVGLVGCHYKTIDERGEHLSFEYRSRFKPGFLGFPKKISPKIPDTPFEAFFASTGQGAFAMYRVSVLERSTMFEESFWSHEDSDIFCQMALLSEVHYINEFLYKLRIRADSLSKSSKKTNDLFRDKWDFYISDNPEENKLIQKSLKYYYTRHTPLRDFKIGLKATRDVLFNKPNNNYKWALECFKNGFTDLLFHKTYLTRCKLRKLAYQKNKEHIPDM